MNKRKTWTLRPNSALSKRSRGTSRISELITSQLYSTQQVYPQRISTNCFYYLAPAPAHNQSLSRLRSGGKLYQLRSRPQIESTSYLNPPQSNHNSGWNGNQLRTSNKQNVHTPDHSSFRPNLSNHSRVLRHINQTPTYLGPSLAKAEQPNHRLENTQYL